ncbi:MAG: PH domain-containing protein, partial [Candidatus Kapaibacterium sp.]
MRTELKKDEKVILITRPHWFTMVIKFMIGVIGIAVGIILLFFALVIAGIPIIVVSAVYLLYKILERNRNIWAVTNMRVIDEEGVFSSDTKESPLDKINNVSYSQSFWGKIFGYGNVDIQTAAEIGETTYVDVEKPGKLKDAIT